MGTWTPPPVMRLEQPDPPVYHSPLDSRAKLMNLQNLALQQQEGKQRLQIGQMTMQEHQRALAQQQAINDAYKNALKVGEDGTWQLDKGQFTQDLANAGHGSAVTPFLEGHAKLEKSYADLGKVKGEVAAAEQDAAGNFGEMVQAGNNDPHLFLNLMTHGVHSGAVAQEHIKPLMDSVTKALDEDPTGAKARDLVGQITDMMIAGSPKQQTLANQRTTAQATARRNTAQGNLADVNTKQKQMELAAQTMPDITADPSGLLHRPPDGPSWEEWRAGLPAAIQPMIPPKFSPAAAALVKQMSLTPDQQRQAKQAADTLAETKKRDEANIGNTETELAVIATNPNETPERRAAAGAALKRLDQSKLASRPVVNNLIPGVPTAPATGAAAELHGEDYLKTLQPAFAARIRQTATGDIPAPTGRAATSGAGLQIMNALMQYDPEYSTLLGKGRTDTLKEFTKTATTSAGGQKQALNTLIHHADLYLDAAAALHNGSFKPGNEIYNKIATMFGAAPPTNAALLSQFLAGEAGKVATSGVPGEAEIHRILQNMSTAGSYEAMEGAGKTLLQVAAGRMIPLKELRDKWKLEKLVDILGPDAKEILQRRGFDPETMRPVAGGRGGAAGGKATHRYNPATGKLEEIK